LEHLPSTWNKWPLAEGGSQQVPSEKTFSKKEKEVEALTHKLGERFCYNTDIRNEENKNKKPQI
jgi:hypothetical protein